MIMGGRKNATLLGVVLTVLAVHYSCVHYQYITATPKSQSAPGDTTTFPSQRSPAVTMSTSQGAPEVTKEHNHIRQSQENSDLQMSLSEDSSSTCNGLRKWVVLTTAVSPSIPALQHLARDLTPEWCVLVVGDEKSPDELSINSNSLIYLSLNKQSSLRFEVVHKTPKNSTCRKNIGYLYAIMNGAEVILDMDSDSIPIPLEGANLPVEENKAQFNRPVLAEDIDLPWFAGKIPVKGSETTVWNPYQSISAHPRGFPINCKQSSTNKRFGVATKTCYPIVQQFLPADIISKNAGSKVVLPHAVFASYDSRSTVHLYEAFWSLLLPKTVGGLESDVWRSYIAESLLYLVPDACVMFTSSSVHHQQNNSNNHHDVNPERPITCDLLNSLKYLPLKVDTFEDGVPRVYGQLQKVGILDPNDVEYVRAWIRDLKTVGYNFPKLPDKSRLWTKNIQLCVMYNYVPGEYYVRVLMAYYLQFFENIMLLFDGEWPEKPSFIPEYVNFSECRSNHGYYQHKCLRTCLTEGARNVEGYLFVADDIFMNLSRMSTLPRSKLWFIDMKKIHDYTNKSAFNYWRWPQFLHQTELVVDNLPPKWKEILVKFIGFPKRFHGQALSDIIYVPQLLASNMVDVLSYIISTTDLFCEIAIPLAVDIVDPQYVHIDRGYILAQNRKNRTLIMSTAAKAHFVHPLKLTVRPTADIWRDFMAKQLKLLSTQEHREENWNGNLNP